MLLRLAAAHARSAGSWSTREALGIARSRDATSRMREVFAGLVPDGFDVLEGDGSRRFRLHPEVLVAPIDWAALADHPDDTVKRIVREHRGAAKKR